MIKTDKYGYAVNAPETYQAIAEEIVRSGSVGVDWTDTYNTVYPMLFAVPRELLKRPGAHFGSMHAALRGSDILFVGILGLGMAGFNWTDMGEDGFHRDYVAEKLFRIDEARFTEGLVTDLINGVAKALIDGVQVRGWDAHS